MTFWFLSVSVGCLHHLFKSKNLLGVRGKGGAPEDQWSKGRQRRNHSETNPPTRRPGSRLCRSRSRIALLARERARAPLRYILLFAICWWTRSACDERVRACVPVPPGARPVCSPRSNHSCKCAKRAVVKFYCRANKSEEIHANALIAAPLFIEQVIFFV